MTSITLFASLTLLPALSAFAVDGGNWRAEMGIRTSSSTPKFVSEPAPAPRAPQAPTEPAKSLEKSLETARHAELHCNPGFTRPSCVVSAYDQTGKLTWSIRADRDDALWAFHRQENLTVVYEHALRVPGIGAYYGPFGDPKHILGEADSNEVQVYKRR